MTKHNIWSTLEDMKEHWSPRVLTEANGQSVKVAKLKGEFVWHSHRNEDEVFLVLKGSVTIQYRDRPDVVLNEGDIHTVPRGVEHNPLTDPAAGDDCWIVLFEPQQTAHTGEVVTDRTRSIEDQRSHLSA